MRRLSKVIVLCVSAAALTSLAAAEARADHIVPVIVYNNPWTWTPAVTSLSTTTFEGLAPANGSTAYPGGVTSNGVNVAPLNGSSLSAVDAGGFGYSFSSGVALAVPAADGLRINFANPVQAAGFEITHLVGGVPTASTLAVTLFKPNGESYTFTTFTFIGVAGFQGYISDAISALEIRFVNGHFGPAALLLDNVSVGQARFVPGPAPHQTPEPASVVLLGAGLAGAVVKIRARRKSG